MSANIVRGEGKRDWRSLCEAQASADRAERVEAKSRRIAALEEQLARAQAAHATLKESRDVLAALDVRAMSGDELRAHSLRVNGADVKLMFAAGRCLELTRKLEEARKAFPH